MTGRSAASLRRILLAGAGILLMVAGCREAATSADGDNASNGRTAQTNVMGRPLGTGAGGASAAGAPEGDSPAAEPGAGTAIP